jgi:hypothetical protein
VETEVVVVQDEGGDVVVLMGVVQDADEARAVDVDQVVEAEGEAKEVADVGGLVDVTADGEDEPVAASTRSIRLLFRRLARE